MLTNLAFVFSVALVVGLLAARNERHFRVELLDYIGEQAPAVWLLSSALDRKFGPRVYFTLHRLTDLGILERREGPTPLGALERRGGRPWVFYRIRVS